MAYALLDQAIAAFNNEYADSIESVEQEHVFLEFCAIVDALRARCAQPIADSQLGQVRRELSGVHGSMANNIRAALIRQEKLNEVADMSKNLGRQASVFEKNAMNLNRLHFWTTC
jgi:hypothetical protein